MEFGLLLLRVVVGVLFIGHGTQKLFGWYGGHGLEGTGGFFESLGYRPGKRYAVLAGLAEAGGGALLVLGLLTPLAAALIIGTMINAIMSVHLENGPWSTDGGYEFPLVMAFAAVAIAFGGGGALAADKIVGLDLGGLGGLIAVVLGVTAGATGSALRNNEADAALEDADDEQDEAEAPARKAA